jgi:voltage-gated potassium channel Kch
MFTIEYCARLAVCQEGSMTHLRFIITPMNVFDLTAFLPFYLELVFRFAGAEDTPALRVFRLVRLVRVIRIFKLGRYATGMRLFGEALTGSTTAISVLVFLLGMGVVLFSSALFYLEKLSCPELAELTTFQVRIYHNECDDVFNRGVSPSQGLCCTEESSPRDFPSVVAAFWWSLVTMTSVGYGEVYPRTTFGKCVGFFAMLVGMVLIALPVAIVGQKFQDVYDNHDLEEAKRRAHVRMKVMGEVWSLEPQSNVCSRLNKMRIKDESLSEAVTALSSYFDQVWEQREQQMRERKYEIARQEEISHKVTKLLSNMEAVLDGRPPIDR